MRPQRPLNGKVPDFRGRADEPKTIHREFVRIPGPVKIGRVPAGPGIEVANVLRIAVVSDDSSLLRSLREFDAELVGEPQRNGFDPSEGADLVLLDVRESRRLGLIGEYTRRGRAVVALSRASTGDEVLRSLDAGADDCVSAEAPAVELAARIRSVARRLAPRDGGSGWSSVFEDETRGEHHPDDPLALADYRFKELTVLSGRHEVWRGDEPVKLTPTEFALLTALARNANQVVTHHKLTAAIWGADATSSRRHLRVHVRHLREKLEQRPDRPELIITEKGRGYRLRVTEQEAA